MVMIRLVFACLKYMVIELSAIINRLQRTFRHIFVSLRMKKKENCPNQKVVDSKCLKFYQPMSLLPVCTNILENLNFDKMFQFFIENKLIAAKRDFKPAGYCI